MNYNLELEKIASEIKKVKAKKVLIQLPDGLKPRALEISDYLKEKTKSEVFTWLGSCFGACDTPILPKNIEKQFDLFVQFGHSPWKK